MAEFLGKQAPLHDERTLKMANYLDVEVPTPPEVKPPEGVTWGMYLNDVKGDCTCAAVGHIIMSWRIQEGNTTPPPTDSDVLSLYNYVNGGQDEGSTCLFVLNTWRKWGIASDKLGAYVSIDPHNLNHIKLAVWMFGAVYVGIALPKTARTTETWDVPSSGPVGDAAVGSWGGHAVNIVGYTEVGPIVVTWGRLQQMTWNFWTTYADEAYAPVDTPDWTGRIPGFKTEELAADLAKVAA